MISFFFFLLSIKLLKTGQNLKSELFLFDVVLEQFGELWYLWLYDCQTVALSRIKIEIVLMVIFCWIKCACLNDLCHDLARSAWVISFFAHLLKNLMGCLLLLFIFIHDCGSVLSTDVVSLSVESCGIMDVEKYVKKGWINWQIYFCSWWCCILIVASLILLLLSIDLRPIWSWILCLEKLV